MLWQDIQSQSRIKDEDIWKWLEQASLDEHKEAQPSTKCQLEEFGEKRRESYNKALAGTFFNLRSRSGGSTDSHLF